MTCSTFSGTLQPSHLSETLFVIKYKVDLKCPSLNLARTTWLICVCYNSVSLYYRCPTSSATDPSLRFWSMICVWLIHKMFNNTPRTFSEDSDTNISLPFFSTWSISHLSSSSFLHFNNRWYWSNTSQLSHTPVGCLAMMYSVWFRPVCPIISRVRTSSCRFLPLTLSWIS